MWQFVDLQTIFFFNLRTYEKKLRAHLCRLDYIGPRVVLLDNPWLVVSTYLATDLKKYNLSLLFLNRVYNFIALQV
jgi:hypothetical protein